MVKDRNAKCDDHSRSQPEPNSRGGDHQADIMKHAGAQFQGLVARSGTWQDPAHPRREEGENEGYELARDDQAHRAAYYDYKNGPARPAEAAATDRANPVMLSNYLNDPVPSNVAEILMVRQRMRSLVASCHPPPLAPGGLPPGPNSNPGCTAPSRASRLWGGRYKPRSQGNNDLSIHSQYPLKTNYRTRCLT